MEYSALLSGLRTELVTGNLTLCGSEWGNHGRHNFSDPFSRLYWVRRGKGAVIYPDKEFTLEPGKLYVFPAFLAARYLCVGEMELYWIHFKAELFGSIELFSFLGLEQVSALEKWDKPEVVFRKFFNVLQSNDVRAHLEADGLLRQWLGRFKPHEPLDSKDIMVGVSRMRPALSYIDHNLHRKISLKELAQTVGLQHAYFCDVFSRTLGRTPLDFVNRRRIEQAQFLVGKGNTPLKEVADKLGFSDVYYFSRVFKKVVGISPDHYRRQVRSRA
ncbi:MAG: helix-turn-helix transcriptional regulator [Victivallales bacterium]|nr:helix-turn-helix transcriptional regulator [Victivallales bacterium]